MVHIPMAKLDEMASARPMYLYVNPPRQQKMHRNVSPVGKRVVY